MTRRLLLEIDAGSTHCLECEHRVRRATESHCALFLFEPLGRDENDMVLRLPECLAAEERVDIASHASEGM